MKKLATILFGVCLLLAATGGIARAQEPDPRAVAIENVLNGLPKCPPGPIQKDCFFGGINVNRVGVRVTTFLARVSQAGDERIDVTVVAWNNAAAAQNDFKTYADQFRSPKATQNWRTESFQLASGASDTGVLEAWLDSNFANEGREAARANGVLTCGAVVAQFNLFATPTQDGPTGKALVDATQSEFKALMQRLATDLSGKGACVATPANAVQLLVEYELDVVKRADPQDRAKGRVEGDSLFFGEAFQVKVQVKGLQPSDNTMLLPENVNPVQVKVEYDGREIHSGQTDAKGEAAFDFTLPEDTPNGRSRHTLRVIATRDGMISGQDSKIFEARRGLEQTLLALDPVEGEYLLGDSVTISGRVWSVTNGIFHDPIDAEIVVEQLLGAGPFRTRTDANGFFKQSIPLRDTGMSLSDATVYVDVTAHPVKSNLYDEAKAQQAIKVIIKGAHNVAIATDKGVYNGGETVQIRGAVVSEGKPVDGSVDLTLDGTPIGSVAVVNGEFIFSYPLAGTTPPGNHQVGAAAQVTGLKQGKSGFAFFTVENKGTDCQRETIEVTGVVGSPYLSPGGSPSIADREKITRLNRRVLEGFGLGTYDGEQIQLNVKLDGESSAVISIGGGSSVLVKRICRDRNGKVHAVLETGDPSRISVNVLNPGKTDIDLQILAPAAQIIPLHTKYYIATEQDGTTTIVALEGSVRICDRNGGNCIELTAVNQITIRPGETPSSANIRPLDGKIDPTLEPLPGAGPAVPQPNTNAPNMTLQAAQRFALANELIRVPVWLIKANNVANLNFEITYDANVIHPEGEILKGNLLDNALFKPNANQASHILVGFAQTSGLEGSGTVMNIPFRVIGKPGDRSPLDLTVTTINDPNGDNLTIDRIPGEIVIVNDNGTLPPSGGNGTGSGTPPGGNGTSTGTRSGGIQNGDCDGSGALNELDALCALEMSVGLRPERSFVDMDNSGMPVTSRDAVIILQRAVGQ